MPSGTGQPGVGQAPWVWAECHVEGDDVVVRLKGWRRVLATRATLRFAVSSIVRIEHDPLARAHVRSGLRNWKRHGQGMWRLGVYHGFDGWSFWSIGVGRNAVLMECSGERFRYVVVEVADPELTVARDPCRGRPPGLGRFRRSSERPGGTKPPPAQSRPSRAGGAPGRGRMRAVSTHRLDYESHREALRRECELIVDAGGEDLGVPVPTCPEWRLSDLLGHLGDVFSFWRVQLEAGSPEVPTEPGATGVPPGAGLVDWFEGTCADLQGALAERDPEEPCWNWSGADLTAGWVCRRMALEAAVHRYDTELAVCSPTPIARELAIDGIDEWIIGPPRHRYPRGTRREPRRRALPGVPGRRGGLDR